MVKKLKKIILARDELAERVLGSDGKIGGERGKWAGEQQGKVDTLN